MFVLVVTMKKFCLSNIVLWAGLFCSILLTDILLAVSKESKSADTGVSNESIYSTFQKDHYVAKISDMGLGKQLAGQSSFGASASFRGQSSAANSNGNVGIGPGTVGWMAPEAMRIKSSPSIASEASNSGEASALEKSNAGSTRASRSVDIFSLGCIFYSTLVRLSEIGISIFGCLVCSIPC